jgi:hypothetical protein
LGESAWKLLLSLRGRGTFHLSFVGAADKKSVVARKLPPGFTSALPDRYTLDLLWK